MSGDEYIPDKYEGNILFINIDSEEVRKFNSEFENIMNEESSGEHMSVHTSKYFINDNILSVVTYILAEAGGKHLSNIYNFDINTGSQISSKDILIYKGISEEEFKEKLPDIYAKEFLKNGPIYQDEPVWKSVDDINQDSDKEAYKDTIDGIPENIDNIQMYLDEKSDLHISVAVQTTAGAGGIENFDVLYKNY